MITVGEISFRAAVALAIVSLALGFSLAEMRPGVVDLDTEAPVVLSVYNYINGTPELMKIQTAGMHGEAIICGSERVQFDEVQLLKLDCFSTEDAWAEDKYQNKLDDLSRRGRDVWDMARKPGDQDG